MHFNERREPANSENDKEILIRQPSDAIDGVFNEEGYLTNGYVMWSRPGNGNGTAVVLWAKIYGNGDSIPQRPPLEDYQPDNPKSSLLRYQPPNATSAAGYWDIASLYTARVDSYHQIAVWLDIASDRCYYRATERFRRSS